MSSAYHPQSDGQTEILNRYLEDYLRCFTSDHPRHWVQFLPWAEFHYNTAWHSSIRMTPFEAIFGRPPPLLLDYTVGSSPVASVEDTLIDRTTVLRRLKTNIARAQNRMRQKANANRTDVSFNVGDWVFLKLQPYRQVSLLHKQTHKLSKRFFGPFQILERIGTVAYRLSLPDSVQIHDVFHVSKLKRCFGNPEHQHLPFPSTFQDTNPVFTPVAVLRSRTITYHGQTVRQFLIQWEHQSAADAT